MTIKKYRSRPQPIDWESGCKTNFKLYSKKATNYGQMTAYEIDNEEQKDAHDLRQVLYRRLHGIHRAIQQKELLKARLLARTTMSESEKSRFHQAECYIGHMKQLEKELLEKMECLYIVKALTIRY